VETDQILLRGRQSENFLTVISPDQLMEKLELIFFVNLMKVKIKKNLFGSAANSIEEVIFQDFSTQITHVEAVQKSKI